MIFLGLQYFSPKKETQPETPAEVASTSTSTSAPKAPAAPASPRTAAPASSKSAHGRGGGGRRNNHRDRNQLYRITFSNRGAQATSWILKKYKDDSGKPLDLVNAKAAAKLGYPLSLWTYDAGMRNQLAQALYVPSASGTVNAPATLTFTYSNNGLEVRRFSPSIPPTLCMWM